MVESDYRVKHVDTSEQKCLLQHPPTTCQVLSHICQVSAVQLCAFASRGGLSAKDASFPGSLTSYTILLVLFLLKFVCRVISYNYTSRSYAGIEAMVIAFLPHMYSHIQACYLCFYGALTHPAHVMKSQTMFSPRTLEHPRHSIHLVLRKGNDIVEQTAVLCPLQRVWLR